MNLKNLKYTDGYKFNNEWNNITEIKTILNIMNLTNLKYTHG
jgi:hypothetical protein